MGQIPPLRHVLVFFTGYSVGLCVELASKIGSYSMDFLGIDVDYEGIRDQLIHYSNSILQFIETNEQTFVVIVIFEIIAISLLVVLAFECCWGIGCFGCRWCFTKGQKFFEERRIVGDDRVYSKLTECESDDGLSDDEPHPARKDDDLFSLGNSYDADESQSQIQIELVEKKRKTGEGKKEY